MSAWNYSEPLISIRLECDDCMCPLSTSSNDPGDLTIYTRNGTIYSQHFIKECPNRWCRKRFGYGYSVKKDTKVFDKMTDKTKYIVCSNETAFTIDFLYEVTLQVLHLNASFQGICDVYNQLHNYNNDTMRAIIIPKHLATGFFLYGFCELTSRCGITPRMGTEPNWIDDAILKYETELKRSFTQTLSSH